MKFKNILFATFIILLNLTIISCSPKDLESLKHNSPVTFTGIITKTGNAPFESLAVYLPKYKIALPLVCKFQSDQLKISKNIGNKMKLNGNFIITKQTIANSTKEVITYSLLVTKTN